MGSAANSPKSNTLRTGEKAAFNKGALRWKVAQIGKTNIGVDRGWRKANKETLWEQDRNQRLGELTVLSTEKKKIRSLKKSAEKRVGAQGRVELNWQTLAGREGKRRGVPMRQRTLPLFDNRQNVSRGVEQETNQKKTQSWHECGERPGSGTTAKRRRGERVDQEALWGKRSYRVAVGRIGGDLVNGTRSHLMRVNQGEVNHGVRGKCLGRSGTEKINKPKKHVMAHGGARQTGAAVEPGSTLKEYQGGSLKKTACSALTLRSCAEKRARRHKGNGKKNGGAASGGDSQREKKWEGTTLLIKGLAFLLYPRKEREHIGTKKSSGR